MTSIEEHLDSYFSSLNPVTKKIWNDRENVKKAFGEEEWNKLSDTEQEDVLARYMIDDDIRQKYAYMEREDIPEQFPRMKINSGEKIVVDFENDDGWTWQDEHSGPFSWMTKSQQDLTLDDLDNLAELGKRGKRGKSRSPERDVGKLHQKDAIYDLNKGTNAEAASTADEIFQKFGITFSFGKNDDEEKSKDVIQDAKSTDDCSSSHYESSNYLNDISEEAGQPFTSGGKKKKCSKTRLPKSEAELCLIDDHANQDDISGGQVSPAYVEDFGESCSSQTSARFAFSDEELRSDSPSVTGGSDGFLLLQDSSSHPAPVGSSASITTEEQSSEKLNVDGIICNQPTSVRITNPVANLDLTLDGETPVQSLTADQHDSGNVKTGFAFLDNW